MPRPPKRSPGSLDGYPVEGATFLVARGDAGLPVIVRAGIEAAVLLGRSPRQCEGVGLTESFHPEDQEAIARLAHDVLSGRPAAVPRRTVRIQGGAEPDRRVELSLYPVTFHRQRLGLGFLMDSVRVPHLANLDLDEPLLLHHLPSESDMSYVLLDHPQLGPVFHPRPGKALKEFLSRHWTEGKPVPMLSLVHPEDRSLVKKQVGLKLRRESGCFQIYSFRLLGGDDLYHEMEVHSYPVQCEGKPAIHGFLRDVAREKREARDLSLHFGQLNHRLRNILTPLRSRLVAISMETGFPKRRKGLMDDCIRTVEEAGAVVSEGLSNTQVSSFELDALTPAAEVIRRIVEDLRRRPPRADIELTLSSGDARIRYHYARFLDLFVNLYDNSCREMQALNRTPRIKLVVSRVAEGRAIRCEWTDEGPGIPEDRKETIFQPFKSFSQRGVGLGLWTARRVAEGHGGSIIENGVPGQGARFILEIPVAREMAQQESSYTSEGSKP